MPGYQDTRSVRGTPEHERILLSAYASSQPTGAHATETHVVVTDIRVPFRSVVRVVLQIYAVFLLISLVIGAVFGFGWLLLMGLLLGAAGR